LQEVVTGFSSKGESQKSKGELSATFGDHFRAHYYWRCDEEARAAKETSKQAAKALRDLRAAHNAWRMQANADKAAKNAHNLAQWQLRCEALPPGAQKLNRPVQPKCKDTSS